MINFILEQELSHYFPAKYLLGHYFYLLARVAERDGPSEYS